MLELEKTRLNEVHRSYSNQEVEIEYDTSEREMLQQ